MSEKYGIKSIASIIQNEAQASQQKLDSIQYLRAFAAYLVVIFHVTASLNSETGDTAIFAVGAIGVDIFFILSGFLMAMIVAERREINGRFLLRRFLRIAPLYYLMTIVLFAIALLAPFWLNSAKPDYWHLVTSLLFLPYPQSEYNVAPILALGWTLNYEMFFYCLVALTTWLFGDRSLRITAIILVALVIAGRIADFGVIWRFYTDPIILEFAAGILVYRYIYLDKRPRKIAVFAALFLGGVAFLISDPQASSESARLLKWGFPALAITTGGIFALKFSSRWLRILGDWSYSTYLVHVFIVQLFVKAVFALELSQTLSPLALIAIIVPVTIAASGLMYRGFELPMMRFLKRLDSQPKTSAIPINLRSTNTPSLAPRLEEMQLKASSPPSRHNHG